MAVGTPDAVRPLLALVREGKVSAQDANVQELIATLGGPDELAAVLDLVLQERVLPEPRRVALLDLLARATGRRKVVPSGDLSRIVPLLASRDDAMRAAALRAAGAWNVPAIDGRLAELAGAADTPGPVRAAAIEAMAGRGKSDGRRAIEALAERGSFDRGAGDGPGRPRGHRPECRGASDRGVAWQAARRPRRRCLARAGPGPPPPRWPGDPGPGDRPGHGSDPDGPRQAAHPPGPRLGPRRAGADLGAGEGRADRVRRRRS